MDNWAETLEAPEQGATYVVAMDYNFPCPFTNPAEVAAGANRQDLQRRTLFQIYKLKPGKQWQPANDMGNIKLVTDYTKVMELNMDEVWEWPTFEAFKFRGLVFFDPCIGSELQAQDQLRGILYSLPPSIVVVEFATSLEHAFIPFMTSPARCGANNVVRMPYLKGICEDFFVQLFHNDPPLFLSTRHMTIGIMPNDDVIEPYLQSISQRVSFDRANGKVHCTMIGRGRARGFYPLEPFLGALQAKMQICLVYELDFTGEQAVKRVMQKIGGMTNNVTEELVIVVSSVKGLATTTVQRTRERPSPSARGTGARGSGSQLGPHQAFAQAFQSIGKVYKALKTLRIMFTDIRQFTIQNETSYQAVTNYMKRFREVLGERKTKESGLITAAASFQQGGSGVRVEIYAHQMLFLLSPERDPAEQPRVSQEHLGGDGPGKPWRLSDLTADALLWFDRNQDLVGCIRHVDHCDRCYSKSESDRPYFNCRIQIAERSFHPSGRRGPSWYGESSGQVYAGNNRAVRTVQHDLSSEAILHYRLGPIPKPRYWTSEEWSTWDAMTSGPVQPQPPMADDVNE